MDGFKILCEISKGIFEISQKKFDPYTAKYVFHWFLFFCVIRYIFEFWYHKSWWDGPPPGGPFHKQILITNKIWWKFHLTVIQLFTTR